MAKTTTTPVTVIEKNEGTKIDWEQNGTKLTFDDSLMINVAKYQKAFPVHLDVCMDADKNLVVGAAAGLFYVAQIDIPEIKYEEIEDETAAGTETEGTEGATRTQQVVIPLDMSEVVLTLWSIDRPTPSVEE